VRINVYTEELIREEDNKSFAEVVTSDYISSRTGKKMTNYGLRIFLRSAPELHYIPGRDDDRSAVTFWVGEKQSNILKMLEALKVVAELSNLEIWRDKVAVVNEESLK
jgi:hypothetical protein